MTQSKPQGYSSDPYSYTYAVNDDKARVNFGESVSGAGDNAKGSYYVSLPDGRLQTVQYSVAGEGGYVADVSYGGSAYQSKYWFCIAILIQKENITSQN